mmetsp:Transcript_32669/g.40148  ORF Transcript_32669/g.40148 Transcript_32669/m.40148 type:complete len:521 (-) Transcript_32669:393-1955(-)
MKTTLRFPVENVVYVMTDFTESNLNFWKDHPALEPFVTSGQLDFAIFDAVNDTELRLQNSGVVLGPPNGDRDGETTKNPMCIVANYLFDTLCHDIFRVEGSVLKEGLISVGSARPNEANSSDPDIINHMRNEYDYRPLKDTEYYKNGRDGVDNVHLSRILAFYRDYYDKNGDDDDNNTPTTHKSSGKDDGGRGTSARGDASILMPIGAIRAIRRLSNMSHQKKLIILSGDKGNDDPEQFRGLVDPHLAVHGSFSVMVNYHAIGAYVTSRGGFSLHGSQHDASLKVSAFVLSGDNDDDGADGTAVVETRSGDLSDFERWDRERSARYPMLKQCFEDNIVSFGPNDFFMLQRGMKEVTISSGSGDAAINETNLSLNSVVSLLKLSDWDADVFYKFRDIIISKVNTANPKLRKDLLQGVPRVWKNHFLLGRDKDVAFEMGRLYYGLQMPRDGLKYYSSSVEIAGEHHVTYYNMGLCHYSLGEKRDAIECFSKSACLNESYVKASNWLEKVRRELEDCGDVDVA